MYQFDKQLDQVSQFIKDESWLDATNELSRAISDHEKLSIIQVERFTALLNQVKRQSDITIQQKTETIYVELFMKQLSINRSGSKAFLQETASISQLLSDIAQVYEYLKQTEMAAWYASYALHQALWIKHQGLILQHQALLKRLQLTLAKAALEKYLQTVKQSLDLSVDVRAVRNAMQIFSYCLTPLIQQEQELEWLIELYRMAEPVFENYCQQLIRRIQLCLVKENDDDIELILPEDTWPNLAEEAVTQLEFFYSLESWLKAKKIMTNFNRKEKIHQVLHEPMKCSLPKETQLQAIYQRYFNYFSKAKPSIKSLSTLVTQSHEDGGKLKIYHEAYEGASETNNENTFLFAAMQEYQKNAGGLLNSGFKLTAEILGQEPEPWQIVSKGSWARGDMGQFSDLDTVIFSQKSEPSNQPYYQALLQLFRVYLIGLGQPWCFVNGRVEPTGLYFDKGDLNIFLPPELDANDNNASNSSSNLAIKLNLIQSPEELAKKVSETLSSSKHADEAWQSSYSLLLLKNMYGHNALIDKFYDEIVPQINLSDVAKKSLSFIKGHELMGLDMRPLPLKNVCKIFLLTMLNLTYLQLQPEKLKQLDLNIIWQLFSAQLEPAFAARWREAVGTILRWRTKYQAKYKNRDVLVHQMSQDEQDFIAHAKMTLIAPFYAGIIRHLENKPNSSFSPTVQWLEAQNSATDPVEMTGLILNLHLAWKEKQTVNLNPSLGQAIWQYVINYIEQEFVLRGFVGDQDPLLQQPTQWQDITVGELLTSIIAADVDPDQLLPAYQASALENAMTQNQVAWALALMNIGAGRHRRFQSEILLNYINQYQHESILTESIKQAKTRLAKHHPYIAWTLSKASLFQSTELKIPGFPNIKGRLIGMDSGEVFLTEKVFNQLFEIKTTVFGKYEVWRKINTEGKHNIARAIVNGQEFYFKSKPESPWREDAVLCLAEQVFRGAVAYSELFMYIDSQGNATPVLVVQGVQGFTAKTMLKALSFDPKEQAEVENQMTPQQANVALKKIDPYRFATLFFLIALTGNEDNNPGNLMFELNEGSLNYLLQLIDCDHSFFEALKYENNQWILVLKSLVLCLDNMLEPLHKHAVREFLTLNNYAELKNWLLKLQQRQEKRNILAEKTKTKTEQYLFDEKIIDKIRQYWQRMRDFLTDHPDAAAIEVLHYAMPRVAVFYGSALNEMELPARYAKISRVPADPKLGIKIDSLKSSNRVEQLAKGQRTISLMQAIKCLEEANKEQESIINIIAALKKEDFSFASLNLIKPESYSELLDQLDWKIPNADKLLQTLVQKQIGFISLNLKSCKQLTDSILAKLLENAPSLLELAISDAPNLTDRIWSILEKHAQSLQRLHLENLPSLKATKQQKLPQLQRLTITECGNLQQIDLVVNGLRNLTLEKLAALRQVQIAAEKLQKISIGGCQQFCKLSTESHALQQLTINDCQHLTEAGIRPCVKSGVHLTKLHLPDTLQIPELIKRHPILLAWPPNFESILMERMQDLLSKTASIDAEIELRDRLQQLLLQERWLAFFLSESKVGDEVFRLKLHAHFVKNSTVIEAIKSVFLKILANDRFKFEMLEALKDVLHQPLIKAMLLQNLPGILFDEGLYFNKKALEVVIDFGAQEDVRKDVLDMMLGEIIISEYLGDSFLIILQAWSSYEDSYQKIWGVVKKIIDQKTYYWTDPTTFLIEFGRRMKEVRSDLCPQLEILLKQGHIINNDFCNAILMVCDWIHHAEIQDKFLLKLLDLAILWTYHPKNNHDLVMRQKEMILMRHIIQAVKGLHYNESVCNKIANYLLNKQNGCLFYLNIFGLPVEGKDNFIRDALSQFRTFLSPDGYVLAAELGGELVKNGIDINRVMPYNISCLWRFMSDNLHFTLSRHKEIPIFILLAESAMKCAQYSDYALGTLSIEFSNLFKILDLEWKILESKESDYPLLTRWVDNSGSQFDGYSNYNDLVKNSEKSVVAILSSLNQWMQDEAISEVMAATVFKMCKSHSNVVALEAMSFLKIWINFSKLRDRVIALVSELLQSKKEEIRAKAVEILGYSMLQESLQYRIFPALLKTRHDRSPAVRQAFVKGIVALHHQSQNQEKILGFLREASEDNDEKVREEVLIGLEVLNQYPHLHEKIFSVLFVLLFDSSMELREKTCAVIRTMYMMGWASSQILEAILSLGPSKTSLQAEVKMQLAISLVEPCNMFFEIVSNDLLAISSNHLNEQEMAFTTSIASQQKSNKGDNETRSFSSSSIASNVKRSFFPPPLDKNNHQYAECIRSIYSLISSLEENHEWDTSNPKVQQWKTTIIEAMAEIEANIIPPQRFEQWEYFENIRLNLLEIQQDYLLSQSRTNQNMSS